MSILREGSDGWYVMDRGQPKGRLIHQDGDLIALKLPGFKRRDGRSIEVYHPAQIQVYRATEVSDAGSRIVADYVTTIPVKGEVRNINVKELRRARRARC